MYRILSTESARKFSDPLDLLNSFTKNQKPNHNPNTKNTGRGTENRRGARDHYFHVFSQYNLQGKGSRVILLVDERLSASVLTFRDQPILGTYLHVFLNHDTVYFISYILRCPRRWHRIRYRSDLRLLPSLRFCRFFVTQNFIVC